MGRGGKLERFGVAHGGFNGEMKVKGESEKPKSRRSERQRKQKREQNICARKYNDKRRRFEAG